MALHVSRAARLRLGLDGWGTFRRGKLELPDPTVARELADRLRRVADEGSPPSAGELLAVSGLEELAQGAISAHLAQRDPGALESFLQRAQEALGVEEAERLLSLFSRDYSLPGHRDDLLRELLVWWAVTENPAAPSISELLHAGSFRADPALARLRSALETPGRGSAGADELLTVLRAPARAAPESLGDQARLVIAEWAGAGGAQTKTLLRGLDLLSEEEKGGFPPGPGPAEVPVFSDLEGEPVRYSSEREWMAGVVLLAKNVKVWLDQLSRRFARPVGRLDEIPDEALAEIAGDGFSALWLIGLWERSAASQRLKRLCGNPEAVASAYSLKAYRVADDLGGDEALAALERRARRHGLRLGADMVPNHLGLDSDWLLEHPERFLSVARSPFPSYSFGGPDLSPDPAVGIYVEDHYYDRSDAAVVFKRLDRRTGEVRYVYHGNDGTTTPWNDTAQLDYMDEKTREAVIREILAVARRFPLIRFDAAMTLTRRHYQRLWFPAPGTGGAIPSRTDHGLEGEEFARRMPREFWSEVVERVSREAPETLLLAEAFWLMEAYFARSLGMHRVYNSAFMNMLRGHENRKYRQLIKETLAFDPPILERYVNFLTNPDERTAIDQFGTGDRYFGSCVLLATLPGLPMFGHGQLEGLSERYGMEYGRSYRDETADPDVVARHRREIVPLLRRRSRFARVDGFELYDFVDSAGAVDDDVLAFSNGTGEERTLVVFNNRARPARGTLRRSVPRRGRPGREVAAALGLKTQRAGTWLLRDRLDGRWFLRSAADLESHGLTLDLGPYGCRVFDRFRFAAAAEGDRHGRLARSLAGEGVADLDRALEELELEPVARALRELLARRAVGALDNGIVEGPELAEAAVRVLRAADAVADGVPGPPAEEQSDLRRRLRGVGDLLRLDEVPGVPATERLGRLRDDLGSWPTSGSERQVGLAAAQIMTWLEAARPEAASRLRTLRMSAIAGPVMDGLGAEPERVARATRWAELAWRRGWCERHELPGAAELRELIARWKDDAEIAAAAGAEHDAREPRAGATGAQTVRWRVAAGLSAALAASEDRQERAVDLVGWLEVMERLDRGVSTIADQPSGGEAPPGSSPERGSSPVQTETE